MQQEDLTHYLHQNGHTYPNMHLRPKLKTPAISFNGQTQKNIFILWKPP